MTTASKRFWAFVRVAPLALAFAAAFAVGCGDNNGTCSADSCVCSEGDTCNQECPDGNCSQDCDGADNCSQDCAGGGCQLDCKDTESCVVDCPGGDCSLNCEGATTCQITSCESGCSLSCGGASNCDSSCSLTDGCPTVP